MALAAKAAPLPKPIIKVGDSLKNGKYEIVKQLGQGGFGEVFKTKNAKTGEMYALKVELEMPKADEPGLHLEIGVLKRMQHNTHFVRYIDDGKLGKMVFLVMQLAGCNLADLCKGCPELKFTDGTTIRLGLQCLEALEALHAAGLLHRDVKPANFAMGWTPTDYRNVYILDFGLVRRFRLKNGKIRPPRARCGFRGTLKYAAVNCHRSKDLGRVDDLWSWVFMLVEFQKSELPWRGELDRKKIGDLKANSKPVLLKGLDPEWERVYTSMENLKYQDEPPYHWYRQKLKEILERKRCSSEDPFDWELHGTFHEQLKKIAPQPYEKQMASKRKVLTEKIEGDSSEATDDPESSDSATK